MDAVVHRLNGSGPLFQNPISSFYRFSQMDPNFYDVVFISNNFTLKNIQHHRTSGSATLGNPIFHYISTDLVIPNLTIDEDTKWRKDGDETLDRHIIVKAKKEARITFQFTYNVATKRISIRTHTIREQQDLGLDANFNCGIQETKFCTALQEYLTSDAYTTKILEKIVQQLYVPIDHQRLISRSK